MGFQFCTSLKHDESVRHGHFVVEALSEDRCSIRMTHKTWQVLQIEETLTDFGSYAMAQEPGEYLIPISLIRGGPAADLIRSLEFVERDALSPTCIYPPCSLPTVTTQDGFALCEEHAAMVQGWDDLLAQF